MTALPSSTSTVPSTGQAQDTLAAIDRSMARIEFELDGTILDANDNFLAALGYGLDEIVGQHHRVFCSDEIVQSSEYQTFWKRLENGEFFSDEFPRQKKDGSTIWIQATYNPVRDADGRIYKVVKFASDITERKIRDGEVASTLNAIERSQAVIEFDLQGNILRANDNFVAAAGYGSLDEIRGQHHRIFVPTELAESAEYEAFWKDLREGKFSSGEFERKRKDGSPLWIQATYNPVFGPDGKPRKVVKFASDITDQIKLRDQRQRFLDEASSVLSKASSGHLKARLSSDHTGPLGAIANSINELLERIDTVVGEIVESMRSVRTSADDLSTSSENLAEASESSARQVASARGSSDELSSNLQSVASGAEEMVASMKEIMNGAQQAQVSAESARGAAGTARESTEQLGRSSSEIEEIISVVSSIAQQTNLLALNATIEAARAGEAGRGFAVVASEVKDLAKSTTAATKEIESRVQSIQSDVSESTGSIGQIVSLIDGIVEQQTLIASAVEEQTATSNEIAQSVSVASDRMGSLSENVTSVAAAATESSASADSVRGLAGDLVGVADQLQSSVSFFETEDEG